MPPKLITSQIGLPRLARSPGGTGLRYPCLVGTLEILAHIRDKVNCFRSCFECDRLPGLRRTGSGLAARENLTPHGPGVVMHRKWQYNQPSPGTDSIISRCQVTRSKQGGPSSMPDGFQNHSLAATYGGEGWSPRTKTLDEEMGDLWGDWGQNLEWAPLEAVLLHAP